MLRILDEQKKREAEEIRGEYPNCKFLIINIDMTNLEELEGNLYCVSDSKISFHEICELSKKFTMQGVKNIVMGDYRDGGALGVQYEAK